MIFSLPRSGSAWLSVLLTYSGTFCYHEPLSDQQPLDELFKRPNSGAVDTLAFTRPELRQKYRGFALKRDVSQIERSSRECGVNYKAPYKQFELATTGLPVIEHSMLSDVAYLEKVWGMVVGTPFDRQRAAQLIGMNIQRDLGKFTIRGQSLAHLIDQKERV